MKDVATLDHFTSQETLAFICISHPIYRTKVLSMKGTFYTKDSAQTLLKKACIQGGADYHGRIASIRERFEYNRCTPLSVDPDYGIFAFPTCSPTHPDCIWLFDSHIHSYRKISNNETEIIFTNKQTLVAKISIDFLRKQMEKTAYCIRHWGKRDFMLDE